ncbi:MAG: hypothetical protein N3F10_04185 [Candidatus Bathyarchaeota archaeon]|nr:hypothetical protein [Candidatus Bathyarchaeota archaeon]
MELVIGRIRCGYARIERITRKPIIGHTGKGAVKDGFGSLQILILTIKKCYKILRLRDLCVSLVSRNWVIP